MVLDFHGVASLQRVTNKGINPAATAQRPLLPHPAFLIYHFLLFNKYYAHSLMSRGYNGVSMKMPAV